MLQVVSGSVHFCPVQGLLSTYLAFVTPAVWGYFKERWDCSKEKPGAEQWKPGSAVSQYRVQRGLCPNQTVDVRGRYRAALGAGQGHCLASAGC